MCVSVLTGCNLVSRDPQGYYEAVVATISYTDGTKADITKRELLLAYSSYGTNYVQNYGYTAEQAIQQTLETIIDNYVTRKAVEDHYEEVGEDVFNANETTYLWDQTYKGVLSNLRSYLEDYKSASEDNSTADQDSSIYQAYKSTVYIDENGVIRKKTPATTIRGTYVARYLNGVAYDFEYKKDGEYTFKELMYNKLMELTTAGDEKSNRDWNNAFTKYISVMKDNYTYYTKTNKEWMMFELDRVYDILKNNYVVEKYEVIFNNNAHQDADISLVQVLDVLNEYATKVVVDYTTYAAQDGASTFEENVLNSISDVDYVLDNGSKYFFVAPVKVNLLDSDKTELNRLKARRAAQTISPEEYETAVNAIFSTSRALVSERNATTGEVEGTRSVDWLAERIADRHMSVEEYKTYFYLYNDETTYKNADYNAVFGIDQNGDVLTNSTYDNDNIKSAILSLYNNGNAQVGDTTELVEVDDGWYVFCYVGAVENVFENVDQNFRLTNPQQIAHLTSKRINAFSNKTLFDVVFSSMSTADNFATFQNMNINNLRLNKTTSIERFESNLKDLY